MLHLNHQLGKAHYLHFKVRKLRLGKESKFQSSSSKLKTYILPVIR